MTTTATVSVTPTCAANYDLHTDGLIDAQDLLLMTDYLNKNDSRGDMNCDGTIDSMDLWHLSEHWFEEQ